MVTYVGVARQEISVEPAAAWYTRISVGTHPLPFDPKAKDPAPFVTALADSDWATRWAGARGLGRLRPPLEPSATPLLTALARDDPYGQVRAAALDTLRSAGKPSPAEPLVFMSFEESAAGWPLGEGLASLTALLPEGYLLEGRDPGGTAWRVHATENELAGREDLDFLLECSWRSGNPAGAYGLALGSGQGTFNAICVSRSGGAVVARFTDGSHVSDLLPWTTSATAAISGIPVTRIEVSKRGASYEIVVNGEAVGGFTDGARLEIDRVGVFVDGKQSVLFRKIVVTAP
jgi:hypothetical protein